MYKLGVPKGGPRSPRDREHVHHRVYQFLNFDSSQARLFAGVPQGQPEVFEQLVKCLEPPYFLLYILHTPRGEGEPGRYQSPQLTPQDVSSFVSDHRDFLAGDGRFDLWGYSPSERATVAWDRHNYIFGYGPLDRFADVLHALDYQPGEVDRIAAGTHMHHYRQELDERAKAILKRFDWTRSDLREEDEQ